MTPIPDTLTGAAAAVRDGSLPSIELVEHALRRIDQIAELNAIAYLDPDRARAEARGLDREARSGVRRGSLHGVPITIKDLYNVRGMPTRAGARAPLPPIEPDEALAIARLRESGALILAKTNMVEIALGLTGENPWTGDVKNPRDPARQAGGSSSGSAASLGAGVGWGSLGSDTAGSIRLPAAYCGVVGFKPSYGLVPLDGALALIPSCDHAGPLVRSVADAAAMFAVLARRPLPDPPLTGAEMLPRLGVPRAYLEGALTVEVRAAFEAALPALSEAGAELRDVSLELGDAAEAFLPLRAESALIHKRTLESHPDAFSTYVRDALMRGYQFSALQYLEARRRQLTMREAFERSMAEVDALIMPTAPCAAPLRGTSEIALESGLKNLRLAILHLTAPAAFAGVPALSLPFAEVNGLPLGLQVITPFGTDERALYVSAWLERALG
jgi:aspartyl-tRNA(Asn)/glutamyl-tRNA(Gln) amidotransferase subunit A